MLAAAAAALTALPLHGTHAALLTAPLRQTLLYGRPDAALHRRS